MNDYICTICHKPLLEKEIDHRLIAFNIPYVHLHCPEHEGNQVMAPMFDPCAFELKHYDRLH